MGNHRKLAKNRKWTTYVTTGVALEVVSLFGFAYATDTHVLSPSLLATTIFVDGTKDVLPPSEPYEPDRLRNTLDGAYAQPGNTAYFDDGTVLQQEDENVFIVYPRSLGILTGPTDPTYDESEAVATRRILAAIEQAQALEAADKDDDNGNGIADDPLDDAIYVVGYSQGAAAAAEALERLEKPDNVEQFVLIANPRRNDGGLLARLPEGTYLPLVGASFGEGTTNPYPEDILVIQVTKQYDGVADSPKYVGNVVADANAALGYYYLHRDYYRNVELDYNGDRTVNQADFDAMEADGYATVTTSAGGGVTDVLVSTPAGQLPLTRPLLDAGVPPETVAALDPLLRAIIETGYDRPAPGEPYPSEPVHFQLIPPPSQAAADLRAVAEGGAQTARLLAALGPSTQAKPVEVADTTTPHSAPPERVLGLVDSTARTDSTTESDTAEPVVDKGDRQEALNGDGTAEPSGTPPARRTTRPDASVRGTNGNSKPADVVRSVLGKVNGPSATGRTTERDASTTLRGSAVARSSARSGSSTGALSPSTRSGLSTGSSSPTQSGLSTGSSSPTRSGLSTGSSSPTRSGSSTGSSSSTGSGSSTGSPSANGSAPGTSN